MDAWFLGTSLDADALDAACMAAIGLATAERQQAARTTRYSQDQTSADDELKVVKVVLDAERTALGKLADALLASKPPVREAATADDTVDARK